ncbi:Type VI secretion protein, EvpB/VC_A0108, tail sheath [Kosakonia oryziphila]|uniref:Type VI secretion protein, EvpB/VC_A0108, tail sheath n=1 Tax=Kosakonia oryziphila TaxID=1005667 RepID=A0A1C4A934_9ENTR|nr:Type VI secretion protein, EvpB/VC_A0108, tail sheath [Kosakonia oryziphila]
MFKQIYEQEYAQFGGEPFGCIIGEFDHSPMGVTLLTELTKISAASPSPLQKSKWNELGNSRNIGKIFTTPEYASWRRLRESNDSRYRVLTMPRLPYGAKTCSV